MTAGESRPPGVLDVSVLFGAVVVIAALSHGLAASSFFSLGNALLFMGVSAVMTGLPALAWSLDRGRGRLSAMIGAGAMAGALPLLLLFLSAVLRLVVLYGPGEARSVLAETAVLPARGAVGWTRFVLLIGQSVLTGTALALVVWLITVDRRRPMALRLGLAAMAIIVAAFALSR